MLEVNIDSKAGKIIFFPDLANNLELAESDRFGVELQHVSDYEITVSARSVIVDKDGMRGTETDYRKYISAHIKRFVNPPALNIDQKEKVFLSVKNLFDFPQLERLWDEIFLKISEVRKVPDIKKN